MLTLKMLGFRNRVLEGDLRMVEHFPFFVHSVEFLYVSLVKCWTYTHGRRAFTFGSLTAIHGVQTQSRISTICEPLTWYCGIQGNFVRWSAFHNLENDIKYSLLDFTSGS